MNILQAMTPRNPLNTSILRTRYPQGGEGVAQAFADTIADRGQTAHELRKNVFLTMQRDNIGLIVR